jgi:hypothetical protein
MGSSSGACRLCTPRASADIYRALDHEILDLVALAHLLKSYSQVHRVKVKITISRRPDCSPRGQHFKFYVSVSISMIYASSELHAAIWRHYFEVRNADALWRLLCYN